MRLVESSITLTCQPEFEVSVSPTRVELAACTDVGCCVVYSQLGRVSPDSSERRVGRVKTRITKRFTPLGCLVAAMHCAFIPGILSPLNATLGEHLPNCCQTEAALPGFLTTFHAGSSPLLA